MEGKIFGYWEQGMEGRIDFAFNAKDLTYPVLIKDGQHLTIYGDEDEVIWSGYIKFVKRRFWEKHNLNAGIWSTCKQKGVSYQQWMAWFWRNPPHKAKLEIET